MEEIEVTESEVGVRMQKERGEEQQGQKLWACDLHPEVVKERDRACLCARCDNSAFVPQQHGLYWQACDSSVFHPRTHRRRIRSSALRARLVVCAVQVREMLILGLVPKFKKGSRSICR